MVSYMSHYYRIVINGLIILVSLGLIGPFLISSKDDILFGTGILYLLFVLPTVLWIYNKNYINKMMKHIDKD